ncbi:MAG TPA: glycosyltransferase 87 family protein [Thermoleophilia bacterium]|nr:glycosyltransferase 87 family protein [Thermoleophilia bacterium]
MSRVLESLPGLSRPSSRAWVGLVLLAAGLLGPAVAGGLRAPASRFVIVYAVAVAGFLLLVSARDALPLRAVVLVALLARLAFLPVAPALSDDHHRYLWDGRVQLAGVNPYLYAPDDARLDEVAFEGRDLVNHPDLRTPYPPLAQAFFLGLAGLGGGVTALKLALGVADLLVAAAVWWLADARRRRRALLLYLACPFVVIETWWSAHLDVLAALFVVLAAGLLVRRRDAPAGVALAAAVLVKVTPLGLVVPALLGRRARLLPFLLGFLPALVLPALPYALTGGVFGSLGEAGLTWKAESAVFDVVAAAGLLALSLLFRGRGQTAAVFAWSWTLVVLLLPSIHPWYWIGPAALGLAAGVWTPVLLGLAAPLRYARWPQTLRSDLLVSIATYLPALAAVPELVAARRRRTARPTTNDGTGARRPERSCP